MSNLIYALIGVHCTHGLNRTGYLICKYMVLRMKIDPQEAIKTFQEARGYRIERNNLLSDIMHRQSNVPRENWRDQDRWSPSRHNWRAASLSSSSYSRSDFNNYKHSSSSRTSRQGRRWN